LNDVKDPEARLNILISDLFSVVFRRTSRGLLHDDQLSFAVRLAQIRLTGTQNELNEEEFQFLLKGGENFVSQGLKKRERERGERERKKKKERERKKEKRTENTTNTTK